MTTLKDLLSMELTPETLSKIMKLDIPVSGLTKAELLQVSIKLDGIIRGCDLIKEHLSFQAEVVSQEFKKRIVKD